MTSSEPTYLSREWAHVENIARELAELEGVPSLANELIQNADDAHATVMRFDIRDDALVVWNDGSFTRCDDLSRTECGLTGGGGHKCDFHRFRLIGSADKRREKDTTGAFGIGFTAVYQITDHPELTSSGERWQLDEMAEPSMRIRREDAPRGHSGTTFRLPWSFDSRTAFRKAVRQPALNEAYPQELLQELRDVLPAAMLFLKHLRSIEVMRDGNLILRVVRHPQIGGVDITSEPGDSESWTLLDGDFEVEASELKAALSGVIESDRSGQVVVALGESMTGHGRLYATLPTQEPSQLPVHIQADFFPRSDRKSVHLDVVHEKGVSYKVAWNRAALAAAARAVSDNLARLPDLLGFASTWKLLVASSNARAAVKEGDIDPAFASFWEQLEGSIADAPIVRITTGQRSTPSRARLLENPEREGPAAGVLESIEIAVVDESLRNLCYSLRSEATGLKALSLDDITEALINRGVTGRQAPGSLAVPFDDPEKLDLSWREVDLLLGRTATSNASRDRFRDVAIAPGLDGALSPFTQVFRADDDAALLFLELEAPISFLDEDRLIGANAGATAGLCEVFDLELAVSCLEEMDRDHLVEALSVGKVSPRELLAWFSRQHGVDELADRLADLPLFPCAGGVRPLNELVIPGDFKDPLGLASVAEHEEIQGLLGFLELLGAQRLTFPRYVERFVPEYFAGEECDPDKTRELVSLLARRFSEIRDDAGLRLVLRSQPLVECEDGEFRVGSDVYLRANLNEDVLGDSVAYAATPLEHRESHSDLYVSVGVNPEPSPEAVVHRCMSLAEGPVVDAAVGAVERIVLHVASTLEEPGKSLGPFAPLADLSWLPLEGDNESWHAPSELDMTFMRQVHETTGAFVGLRQSAQPAGFLAALGVRTRPTTDSIVDHLLNCVRERVEVHRDVYRRLNDWSDEPGVERLRETRCLLLENGEYVRPNQVFWGDHPFGRFRYRIGDAFVQYQDLLAGLGVKQTPDAGDAIAVLVDVAAEFYRTHDLIDDDDRRVIMQCWRILSEALEAGDLDAASLDELRRLPVVPNLTGKLRTPELIFFDNWNYLASCFDRALSNDFIKRPSGAWRAMGSVGVGDLTAAVTTEIVELEGGRPDEPLVTRIRTRQHALSRVIEMRGPEVRERLGTMLDALEVTAASRLLVRHTLEVAGHHYETPALAMPAVFLDPTLHYVADRVVPWSSIAREIVRGLLPREEPGDLASTVQLILTAQNAASADATLDDLGFPRIDQTVYAPTAAGRVSELGGSDQEFGDADAAWQAPATPLPIAGDQEAEPVPTGEDGSPFIADLIDRDVEPTGADDGATPLVDHKSTASRERPRPPESKRAKSSGGRFVGKSFVEPETASGADSEPSVLGTETERAAVDAALRFERMHGREPREMPPLNPGYDIESGPPGADPDRFIEVKGTATSWAQRGVEVTPREFQTARDKGDQYWLYVVDDARNDELRVLHTIRNPVKQINRYVFDDGWRSAVDQVWRPLPQPPAVTAVADAQSPDVLPYFDIDLDGIGESGAEVGYIDVGSRAHSLDWFLVQLRDEALGAFGHLTLIEPAKSDVDNEDLLVDLRDTDLRLPCAPVTGLRLRVDHTDEGLQYLLDLGAMGVETIPAAVWQRARVLGRIRDTWPVES